MFRQRLSFFPIQRVKTNYYNQQVCAITLNYFGHTKENTYVAACVVLTEERLTNTLLTNSVRSGGVLIVRDARGNELLSYGADQASRCAMMNLTGEEGLLHVEVGIPESFFEQSVSNVRGLIALYSTAALLVAAIMAVVFGTRQYKPARDYFCYVQSKGIFVLQARGSTAVSSLMNDSLRGLQFQHNSMVKSIQQLKRHNQDMLLKNLLNGIDVESKDVEQHLNGIKALDGSYLLLRVYIEGSSVSLADTQMLHIELNSSLRVAFPNAYFLASDPNVVIVPAAAQQLQSAYTKLGVVSETVHYCGNVVAVLICSCLHHSVNELSAAYSETRQLIRHLHVFEGDRAFLRYDLVEEYTSNMKTNLYHAEDLLTLLQPGNEKNVQQWMKGYLRQLVYISLQDAQRAAAQYYAIVNILYDVSRKWNVSFTPQTLDEKGGYDQLAAYLMDSVVKMMETINRQSENRDEKHKILTYLDTHYHKPDMCLGTLADRFKLSQAHISRIIKAHTGMTYGAYIEQLRMNRAKELLENGEMPVKDIAYNLGYENQSTFMKAFKRFYHVPPTSFRQGSTYRMR